MLRREFQVPLRDPVQYLKTAGLGKTTALLTTQQPPKRAAAKNSDLEASSGFRHFDLSALFHAKELAASNLFAPQLHHGHPNRC
jgi:hypothetical protein